MSEQQFAQFICSTGRGEGTPCTFRFRDGQLVSSPSVQLPAERHYDEAKSAAQEAVQHLDVLAADLVDLTAKLPRKQQESIRARIASARRVLADHMPWIVQMMHEHMDKVVGAAKHEI